MTIRVLKSSREIKNARSALRRKNASCLTPSITRWFRQIGLASGINIGDRLKSWDVYQTATFIQENLDKDSPVLDVGAYSSEILCTLKLLGFTNLAGVDLNPDILHMPFADVIHYNVSDFTQTPFQAESFEAVTAISVIEHGFQGKALLTEISRLLRPGGYFIASFDFWTEKVDTTGVKLFGMDWMIFSKNDVLSFIEESKSFGFTPCGPLNLDAMDRPIQWGGKSYTFAWLVIRKT